MTRTEAALSLAGGFIGAALLGIPVGAWLAGRWLAVEQGKPYSQAEAVATGITNLKGAKQ